MTLYPAFAFWYKVVPLLNSELQQVWDYQARTCVQTLGEHTHNVSCVAFHPDLPIIITGAEDGQFTFNTWFCMFLHVGLHLTLAFRCCAAFPCQYVQLREYSELRNGADLGDCMS
jgi:WD40 repeat protein